MPQLIFILCICGFAGTIAFWAMKTLMPKKGDRVRERLSGKSAVDAQKRQQEKQAQTKVQMKDLFQKIGQAAAKPFMPENREKQSALRRKLAMAGIYSPSAIRVVTGFKVILLGGGLVGGYVLGVLINSVMLCTAIGGLIGYVVPALWLRHRVKTQQKNLEYSLPDALDLMVVCVEAGLAVDAAMQRVGQELHLAHPDLSRELDITHMETRVGLSRAESLRNMGSRTGSPPLQSLASMLVQAERFGTSVATALRVHGDSLRVARQHKAEEMASKASVKMSVPLVLFIFPATFIVLAGPTVIGLMKSSLFN